MNKKTYLFRPLYAPFLLLLILAALVYFGYQMTLDKEQSIQRIYQKHTSELNALNKDVQQLQKKVELINTYFGQFQQLEKNNIFDASSRVSWIDRFMDIIRQYDVRHSVLGFSVRNRLEKNDIKGFEETHKLLQYETLELQGNFQHEDDWFNFLSDVQSKINTLYLLESCHLQVIKQDLKKSPIAKSAYHFEPDSGNMSAKCQIRFLIYDIPKVATKE